MIQVFGHSSDRIEVDGKNLDMEFVCSDDKGAYLAFSDGTLLGIKYAALSWRIDVLQAGSSFISKDESDNRTTFSDIIYLGDDVKWVVYGQEFERSKKG